MIIEKVHGLQATSISLSERFTMLTAAYLGRIARMRRRTVNSYNPNSIANHNLIQQYSYRMQQQAKRQQIKQRLSMPLRRFGSESSLPRPRRNSTGSLNLTKQMVPWTTSNGSFSQTSTFSGPSQMTWRSRGAFRRRGGSVGPMRGRLRGRGTGVGRHPLGQLRGAGRGRAPAGGRATRGRGRGGISRNQVPKKLMTKEELDAQLDQYMASTKVALDKEIEDYMKNSIMEIE